MPADVIMPALGMAQDTGTIVRWLKSDGDDVRKGEPLVEIETDKVTVEIEAPADGTLAGVRAGEGDDVPVGSVIAVVLAAGDVLASPDEVVVPSAPEPVVVSIPPAAAHGAGTSPRRQLASPKARRLAASRGVALDALAGSGPGGAIVASDIETAEHDAVFEVGPVWRVMAERTTRAWQEVPQFVLRRDVDATRLQERKAAGGKAVSHTDLLVQLTAEALVQHLRVNASWRDGTIVPGSGVNVAIAVATEDGLVAPVVHNADRLDLAAIALRRTEIVAAARESRLRPEDMSGGTFTISNLGMYGVDSFDAIVNVPQAAILAVGRIANRIVPIEGQPAVRPMMSLSVSFDHRVVDGARGAAFLDTLASLLEGPAPES